MHFGIDVSSNNHPGGAGINWPAAYADLRARGGAQPFVIVKATQGVGYVNPYFLADVTAAQQAGFAVAAYLMDQGSDDPAAEEAAFRRMTALPQFDDDELPFGNAAYAQHCAQLVAQNPAAPVYLNQSEVAAGYPQGAGLWLADYNKTPGTVAYPCLIHQYDDVGSVAGIAGSVDLDVFLGSEAEYVRLFAYAVDPPAPTPVETITGVVMQYVAFVTPDKNCQHFSVDQAGNLLHRWQTPGKAWVGPETRGTGWDTGTALTYSLDSAGTVQVWGALVGDKPVVCYLAGNVWVVEPLP